VCVGTPTQYSQALVIINSPAETSERQWQPIRGTRWGCRFELGRSLDQKTRKRHSRCGDNRLA